MGTVARSRRELIAMQIASGRELDGDDMACIVAVLLDRAIDRDNKPRAYKAIRKPHDKTDNDGRTIMASLYAANRYAELRETMSSSDAYKQLASELCRSEERARTLAREGRNRLKATQDSIDRILIERGEFIDICVYAEMEDKPEIL